MLVKNGDFWSYPHFIVLVGYTESAFFFLESAFLMIPQAILVPSENCLALAV